MEPASRGLRSELPSYVAVGPAAMPSELLYVSPPSRDAASGAACNSAAEAAALAPGGPRGAGNVSGGCAAAACVPMRAPGVFVGEVEALEVGREYWECWECCECCERDPLGYHCTSGGGIGSCASSLLLTRLSCGDNSSCRLAVRVTAGGCKTTDSCDVEAGPAGRRCRGRRRDCCKSVAAACGWMGCASGALLGRSPVPSCRSAELMRLLLWPRCARDALGSSVGCGDPAFNDLRESHIAAALLCLVAKDAPSVAARESPCGARCECCACCARCGAPASDAHLRSALD